ncbi:conserved hypothetical protein [Candidatus Zixiibacteriota bacterium]|nr:conserved hypothetical protein [candidate division Zixibacteria bacterium]
MESEYQIDWFEKEDDEDVDGHFKEYEISASPNDFNINTIFDFINSGVVEIPGFQRNYVWDKKRASKLIESIIMGIPIPQLFLYERAKNSYIVIDGHQRLMSIYYFRKSRFPKKEARAKLRRIFNEEGRIPDSVLYDNSYFTEFNLELADPTESKKNKLHGLNYNTLAEYKSSFDLKTIRNIFIKQLKPPEDDGAIYELFNRLNTGGVNLAPQEIRASLYHSHFYDMLNKINLSPEWRKLIGLEDPDIHMKDLEILLRGFAMLLEGKAYSQSMVRFLNTFSNKAKSMKSDRVKYLEELFLAFIGACNELSTLDFTFKTRKFNALIYEAVFSAVCKRSLIADKIFIPNIVPGQLETLKKDDEFVKATQLETARKINVDKRLEKAEAIFCKS